MPVDTDDDKVTSDIKTSRTENYRNYPDMELNNGSPKLINLLALVGDILVE